MDLLDHRSYFNWSTRILQSHMLSLYPYNAIRHAEFLPYFIPWMASEHLHEVSWPLILLSIYGSKPVLSQCLYPSPFYPLTICPSFWGSLFILSLFLIKISFLDHVSMSVLQSHLCSPVSPPPTVVLLSAVLNGSPLGFGCFQCISLTSSLQSTLRFVCSPASCVSLDSASLL